MALDVPTLEELLARFPFLAEYPTSQVQAALDEASTEVDERWATADQKKAIMYLTAHLIQSEADGGGDSGAAGNIASESMGPISVSYRDIKAGETSDYSTTYYGRRYQMLLDANFGGVLVVGAEDA